MIGNLINALALTMMSGVFAIGALQANVQKNINPYINIDGGALSTSKIDGSDIILYQEFTVDLSYYASLTAIPNITYSLIDEVDVGGGNTSNLVTHAPSLLMGNQGNQPYNGNYYLFYGFTWEIQRYTYAETYFPNGYNITLAYNNSVEFRFYTNDNQSHFGPSESLSMHQNFGSGYLDYSVGTIQLDRWYSYTSNASSFLTSDNPSTYSILEYLFVVNGEEEPVIPGGMLDIRFLYYISTDFTSGYNSGFSNGYNTGYATALSTLGNNTTFLSLFSAIADTPLRFLYGLFNFDLFGTSMLIIILSLLTGIVVFGVVKKFWK